MSIFVNLLQLQPWLKVIKCKDENIKYNKMFLVNLEKQNMATTSTNIIKSKQHENIANGIRTNLDARSDQKLKG